MIFRSDDIQNCICDGCTLVQCADDCMVYASSTFSSDALSHLHMLTRAYILFCFDEQNLKSDRLVINNHYVDKDKKSECKKNYRFDSRF